MYISEISAADPRCLGKTDSETLQKAVDLAASTGIGKVVIPRMNPRTGESVWIIDKTIYLPSDTTIILDNCHLRLEDDVRENIFRNSKAFTAEGNTLEGEEHDIRIIGIGNAVLDGGKPNGLCEQLHRDDPEKYPNMNVNLLIFMHNVRNFEVRGIKFIESRWWAVCFMFCRWGMIADLDFRMYGTLENQDGVDLRIGCEYITIENITGITGDDTVALTALPREMTFEGLLYVKGKSFDIHDITIRNIMSSTHGCGIVRLLCEDGAREYNITITDLKDTGETIAGSAVLIGTNDKFLMKHPHEMGDFKNIIIRNVTTTAQRGLSIYESVQNMVVENLTVYGCNEVGLRFGENFAGKNVRIKDFTFDTDPETADSVFCFRGGTPDLGDVEISRVRARSAKYVFRGREIKVDDFVYEDPSEGYFTPESSKLKSAYGRYHKFAYGKLIENRPDDSRFKNEKK